MANAGKSLIHRRASATDVYIIGGGIAGLTTALALQNKGIDFRLFEKNGQITYENVGFGISANIFPILENLNILSETEKLGAKIKHFHFVDKKLNYINSFPIHHSQVIENIENGVRVTLKLKTTPDFIMEIMSRAWSLKVIKPVSLQLEITEILKDALLRNQ